MKNLVSLSFVDPYINKSIYRKVINSLKANGNPSWLCFEPCYFHIVHHAFRKGLNCLGSDTEEWTFGMHQFIKQQLVRIENLKDLQLEYDMDGSPVFN
jgi:hypothetical protein